MCTWRVLSVCASGSMRMSVLYALYVRGFLCVYDRVVCVFSMLFVRSFYMKVFLCTSVLNALYVHMRLLRFVGLVHVWKDF